MNHFHMMYDEAQHKPQTNAPQQNLKTTQPLLTPRYTVYDANAIDSHDLGEVMVEQDTTMNIIFTSVGPIHDLLAFSSSLVVRVIL